MIGLLAEKHSQAKAIAEALDLSRCENGFSGVYQGKQMTVVFARGHLLGIEAPTDANPQANWSDPASLTPLPRSPSIKPAQDKAKDIKKVKAGLKGVTEVIIATDPDREGEAIGRDLLEYLGVSVPMRRLWLTGGLDGESVRAAMGKLRAIEDTDGLYGAQRARSVSDWFYTFMTMAATAVAERGLMGPDLGQGKGRAGVASLGRVQTPTLRLVVDRDAQIEDHIPVDHFVIAVELEQGDRKSWFTYKPILTDDQREFLLGDPGCGFQEHGKKNQLLLLDRSKAERFIDELKVIDGGRIDIEVETKDTLKKPPKPFSQIELQREAGKKLGLSPQKTLEIASELYLAGYISYPGTDRDMLPLSEFEQSLMILSGLGEIRGIETGGMTLDDLSLSLEEPPACYEENPGEHFALMPTMNIPTVGELGDTQEAVYDLVVTRFIEAHFPAAVIEKYQATAVFLDVVGPAGESEPVATASASTTKEPGWLAAFGRVDSDEEREGESDHPGFVDGSAKYLDGDIKAKKTSPPERYTESSLLADMKGAAKFLESEEERELLRNARGLGTARTRGVILEVLLKREYLVKKKGKLISTPKGRALIAHVDDELSSVALTAKWEGILNSIEAEKGTAAITARDAFIASQAERLEDHLDAMAKAAAGVARAPRKPSPKSLKFAQSIASTLGIELSADTAEDADAVSAFIEANKAEAFAKPKPPTPKALKFAQRIASMLDEAIPEEAQLDYKACSAYINEKKPLAFPD